MSFFFISTWGFSVQLELTIVFKASHEKATLMLYCCRHLVFSVCSRKSLAVNF